MLRVPGRPLLRRVPFQFLGNRLSERCSIRIRLPLGGELRQRRGGPLSTSVLFGFKLVLHRLVWKLGVVAHRGLLLGHGSLRHRRFDVQLQRLL